MLFLRGLCYFVELCNVLLTITPQMSRGISADRIIKSIKIFKEEEKMKSIFKKIAFVLALAMVVTMLPAKAVSAASSDGPDMYKSLLLYLDSGNG